MAVATVIFLQRASRAPNVAMDEARLVEEESVDIAFGGRTYNLSICVSEPSPDAHAGSGGPAEPILSIDLEDLAGGECTNEKLHRCRQQKFRG